MVADWEFFGNTVQDWLNAALIAAGVLAALWIVVRFLMSRLATFARTNETDIDDLVAHVGAQTKLKLLVMPALFAGSFALVLPEQLTV